MKPTQRIRRFLRVPKIDGVTSRVPVSDFVLNLRKQPVPVLSAARRSPFMQQGAALALTVVLCASSFGMTYANPINTLSYFRDNETSRTNLFAAGLLGFSLNPGDVTLPIAQGDTVTLSPLFTPLPEALDISYRVRAEIVGSETPLCALLRAAGTSSPYVYDGSLKDLVSAVSTTTGHGHLEVTLPEASGIANGTECTVALSYKGWASGTLEDTGYTDQHRDTFTFVYSAPTPPTPPEETNSADEPATQSLITEAPDETTPPETPEAPVETPTAPESAPEVPPETPEEPETTAPQGVPPSEPPAETIPAPEVAQPAPVDTPTE